MYTGCFSNQSMKVNDQTNKVINVHNGLLVLIANEKNKVKATFLEL